MLSNQLKEILGARLRAIGSILSAISVTFTERLSTSTRADLNRVGLAIQAAGSTLETEGQSSLFSLEYTGTAITTIGILENLTASLIEFPDEIDTNLLIQGNLLKAVGSTLVAFDEIQDSTDFGALEGVIGNLIQATGSVIQIIAFKLQYTSSQPHADTYIQWNQQSENQGQRDGQNLLALGAWIQAIGAVIVAIAQQKEEMHEIQLGIEE